MMDATLCNVLYVDRTVKQDRLFDARSRHESREPQATGPAEQKSVPWESRTLEENIGHLADVFGDVHLCGSGSACIARLFNLQDTSMLDLKPTIVLIDIPHDERIPPDDQSRSPSPHSAPLADAGTPPKSPPTDEIYGLQLLQRIVSEAHLRNLSKLVVPVSVISTAGPADGAVTAPDRAQRLTSRPLLKRCLKLGATDVLFSPIHPQSISSLEVRAYWAHKNAARDQQALLEFRRGRKRSWVGISDNRPYAYLRENMVAGLMRGICQMEDEDELPVDAVRIAVSSSRKPIIAKAVGSWHFSAHDYSDDELVEAAVLMFKHAFSMPELADWRIPTDKLVCFLIACRAAYNSFVPYHNFRHVVDVLQATFSFLVHIGSLPPYPLPSSSDSAAPTTAPPSTPRSPMASLIHPFEALTLLITAIGHDVGHPGVNNGFLIVLNAPLAQLYNDESVLESFHCAAYSQILRRYWPSAFHDTKMRKLMISSILATDMGMHFSYMKRLGSIQDKLAENNTTDGWNGRMFEEQTALACALLIKCADISNVARQHGTAIQWMHILSDEFARQAYMEDQLSIKSSLVAPPKKDKISLFRAQLGFMNIFAIPLFQGIAAIMPAMQYCLDELETNKALFEQGVADETAKLELDPLQNAHGTFSPRSLSVAAPMASATAMVASSASPTSTAEHDKEAKEVQGGKLAEPETNTSTPSTETGHAVYPAEDAQHTTANESTDEHENKNGSNDTIAGTKSTTPRPVPSELYTDSNGFVSDYDSVAEFAASDPFNTNDGQPLASSKQRVSETTDGSTSLPSGSGDWASQATSATTGRMPLSPSTRGTSIISHDSFDRSSGLAVAPVETVVLDETVLPGEARGQAPGALAVKCGKPDATAVTTQVSHEYESSLSSGGHSHNGHNPDKAHRDGPTLRKKSSRFRMNALTFFRRHLSSSPPIPTSHPDSAPM